MNKTKNMLMVAVLATGLSQSVAKADIAWPIPPQATTPNGPVFLGGLNLIVEIFGLIVSIHQSF